MILLNGKELELKKFPNGETLIETNQLNYDLELNTLEIRFENDLDLMNMVYIKKHLDDRKMKTELLCKYLPYSRMDRTEGYTLFTLKYVCSLINSLNFENIKIYEPHSNVCMALIDRLRIYNTSANITEKVMNEEIRFSANDYLFYPDEGACKRYSKQIKYNNVLTGSKVRDFKTGNILRLDIQGEIPKEPFKVIIVDDLCSKGGTFMLSANKLKELGATDIYLVVTHCENTIFDGDILNTDLIKRVYTTNSILNKNHEKIKIMG